MVLGSSQSHVFLDSLDECLLRIDTVSELLIGELKKYPVHRLLFRIACRTAQWPNTLERGLKQLWGNDAVQVYELAPLRRVDVAEAARVNGLDSGTFLSAIERMGAAPLAIKPVTLDFLLRTYRHNSRLPSTQTELYGEGCRLLCEETSETRREASLTGNLSAHERMAVAARIAAVTVLGNRYAVWMTVDRGDVPPEDVTVQQLSGGTEIGNGQRLEVTEPAIREALSTGLFSSRGSYRLGWAHQTYAEFLAAHYLTSREMTVSQMMSLIVHPGDPEGKLVPQLYEASAWLAGMNPDVFREIMKAEPEALLRSDVAAADVTHRAALVETLLKSYEEEKLLDHDFSLRQGYRKLAHLELTEQLRPYICDGTKGIVVRRFAIDMAEGCELRTDQLECSRTFAHQVS